MCILDAHRAPVGGRQRPQVDGLRVATDRRPGLHARSHPSFIDAVRKRIEAQEANRVATQRRAYRPRRTRSIASSLHSCVRMIR